MRWEAGSLDLPSHPDIEGELVLAALGGDRPRCVDLAQAWARHTDDLSVLAIGPRGPDDRTAVDWEDVLAAEQTGTTVYSGSYASPRSTPMRLASPSGPTVARAGARQRQMQAEQLKSQQRRNDVLSLLALGYGFQVRLIGQVAAAHADRDHAEQVRPALIAAITGRLAPVAEEWLGIDPDQVEVDLHAARSWGASELTGYGRDRRLRLSLPAGWLARVWACGLARVGRYLVVGVTEPGWPRARVLGLRSPGAQPEPLDVHADPDGPSDVPHWEI